MLAEALRIRPDVIVTDFSMPTMNGIEAIHQLRRQNCDARFVLLTQHTSDDLRHASIAAGASAYLNKSRIRQHLIPAILAAFAGEPYTQL
jgi:DNA-binding NarL/FixJ family response regulator